MVYTDGGGSKPNLQKYLLHMCGHCGVAKEHRLADSSRGTWDSDLGSWLRDDEGFYSGYCSFYWLWLARRILQRAVERMEQQNGQFWAVLQGL